MFAIVGAHETLAKGNDDLDQAEGIDNRHREAIETPSTSAA